MNINPINRISFQNVSFKEKSSSTSKSTEFCPEENKLVKELDKMKKDT